MDRRRPPQARRGLKTHQNRLSTALASAPANPHRQRRFDTTKTQGGPPHGHHSAGALAAKRHAPRRTRASRTSFGPVQLAAGVVPQSIGDGGESLEAKYGLHALRPRGRALFIEQGLSPKRVQTILGHSSIKMTYNVYGYLFASEDDERSAMAEIERGLPARRRCRWPHIETTSQTSALRVSQSGFSSSTVLWRATQMRHVSANSLN